MFSFLGGPAYTPEQGLLVALGGLYSFKTDRGQQELQRSIEVGDEVITTSGVYGTITGEDGDSRFWLEIDDDVQIRIAKAAIQRKVDTSGADADSDDGDDSDDVDEPADADES